MKKFNDFINESENLNEGEFTAMSKDVDKALELISKSVATLKEKKAKPDSINDLEIIEKQLRQWIKFWAW